MNNSTSAVFYVIDNAVRSFPDNIVAGPFASSVDADAEYARLSAAGRDCRVERDETIGLFVE